MILMSAIGPEPTSLFAPHMSAFGGKADMERSLFTAAMAAIRMGHSFNFGGCG
jgi:hypothetical protein